MSDICQPPERPTGPPEPELRRNDRLRHWIEAHIGKEMTRRSMLMEEAIFEAWGEGKGIRVTETMQTTISDNAWGTSEVTVSLSDGFKIEVTDEVPKGQIHYVRSDLP